jgi:hypothetical protein
MVPATKDQDARAINREMAALILGAKTSGSDQFRLVDDVQVMFAFYPIVTKQAVLALPQLGARKSD